MRSTHQRSKIPQDIEEKREMELYTFLAHGSTMFLACLSHIHALLVFLASINTVWR